MKRFLQFVLALTVLITPTAQGQTVIFQEDFDGVGGPDAGGPGTYTFPAGWLLRNVDNRTPDGQVAYVNEAWERREDFANNVTDSAAFSTSWYSPVGAADDWMWTPLIGALPANCNLKWNAVAYDPAYPDGYEVRIMVAPNTPTGGTGTLGNQVTNSTVLYSTAAEASTWTARTVSLAAYTGQSVYIGFRNNSNNQFLLLIDDVVVEQVLNNEVSIQSTQQYEYTLTPVSQVPASGLALSATIRNNGINAATNLVLTARVYDSNNVQVFTASSTPTTLASGATTTLSTTAGFVPAFADNFTVEYEATMTAVDDIPANNIATDVVAITNNVYARDNGNVVGALGIGAGNGGYLGQDFAIENTTNIGAVQVYYTQGYTGEKMAAVIWDMSGGFPNAIVASTDTLTYPDDSARLYTLPIHGGGFTLNPGRYAITAVEFDSTAQVGLTLDIYTPGRTWVDWPTNPVTDPWGNNEDYGASFQRAYVIRPVLCPGFSANPTSTDAVCTSNGTATVAPTGGEEPYTYNWSNSGTADNISAPAGTYSVTITDNLGCQENTSVTINSSTVSIASTTSANNSNCTAADGSASVTPSNGTAPYIYAWSNGGTSSSISNLSPATYTVTITDSKGCVGQNTATVAIGGTTLNSTTSSTSATCAVTDGTASVTVNNGQQPYTYAWSNSGNTASITGLTAGNYSVTVTDANGCTGSNSVSVSSSAIVIAATVSSTDATCTAANGSLTAVPTNGTSPYTYNWSGSQTGSTATNLTAGNYTVTITDAVGCTGATNATVTATALTLSTTTNATSATCTASNGSVSVAVNNGTSPYTYVWSNGGNTDVVNNQPAGSYTVTATDANGCSATASVDVLTDNVILSLTTSTTETGCTTSAGTATVDNVADGTAPYTYLWSDASTNATATALAAGGYQVTVTDANGCSATAGVTVGTAALPTATATATDVDCSGGATGGADVTLSGAATPVTYLWSNGATTQSIANLAAGSYNVTATDDNGCSVTASVTVNEPTALAVTASVSNATNGNNGAVNINVTGGSPAYSYNWSNSAVTEDISGLGAGTYTVTVTDNNGCTATATYTLVSVGLANTDAASVVKLFPNPATDVVQLQISLVQSDDLTVQLADVTGKLVMEQYLGEVKDKAFILNLSTIASGVYHIRISGNNVNTVQRLVIEK